MASIGMMEIFFGPPWTHQNRLDHIPFLAAHQFEFYLYAPKADALLRKRWREPAGKNYLDDLRQLSRAHRAAGLKFGVALSPFGAQEKFDPETKDQLRRKTAELESIGLDYFGLFFDDMPGSEGLAARQLEVIDSIVSETRAQLLFCPSYYSPDPILDKVFGARPPGYLEELGRHAPSQVEFLWTGPKVISPDIPADHLQEVAKVIRRQPFLCDNLYANDGPKNCKFLKLRPCLGRLPAALAASSGWAFNPMNQPEVSRITLLSSAYVMRNGIDPEEALTKAIRDYCPPPLAEFLEKNISALRDEGLDKIGEETKSAWRSELTGIKNSAVADEILAWLSGAYTVGNECLTD